MSSNVDHGIPINPRVEGRILTVQEHALHEAERAAKQDRESAEKQEELENLQRSKYDKLSREELVSEILRLEAENAALKKELVKQ